jgi:hypothetical protein
VSGEPPGAYLLNMNVYYLSGTVRTQTRTIYVDTLAGECPRPSGK